MKVKLAFTAITTATLALVACQPSHTPGPVPSELRLPESCLTLHGQPPYDVRYEDGSVVHVPSGRELFDELQSDGAPLGQACQAMLDQFVKDHR